MLKGDRRCEVCGRVIFSYTKVTVNFKDFKMKCPFCNSWLQLEIPNRIKKIEDEIKRVRAKTGSYSKSVKKHNDNFKKLENLIEGNYKLSNDDLIDRLKISRSTFYSKYREEADRLRGHYKSIALF